jgi:hypothetical protein
MMEEARRQRHRRIQAAVIAQLAVAIAIEAVAPVRLENLTSIRLGVNLTKPDGPNSNYRLHFMPEHAKNNVRLQFVFKEYLMRLIDEYVQDFWPTLLRGRREDYLFPGLRKGAKGKVSFSGQISGRIYRGTGLQMTVHQFRHAAGAIILKNRPGEFELVRQILGHRRIATTMRRASSRCSPRSPCLIAREQVRSHPPGRVSQIDVDSIGCRKPRALEIFRGVPALAYSPARMGENARNFGAPPSERRSIAPVQKRI